MRTLAIFLLLTTSVFAHRTAQEAAEASAVGGLRHRGGNPSYEGLGCASTPEAAFRSCCYARHSGLETYDVGIARSRNGLWVCCRRYCSKGALHRIGEYLSRAGLKKQKSCLADCFESEDEAEETDGE
jgi:hypothetical protein